MSVSAVRVRMIRERDGGRCAACGGWGNLTTQHRMNRSVGGTDLFPNILTLCWKCNTDLEASAQAAQTGREKGWKVQSWEDPAVVAVWFSWAREWRLLDGVGDVAVVTHRDPEERARAMDEWSRE